jgi:preprotein translocase subunit SecG
MTTLHTVVLVIHVLIAAMIVGLVLVQRGKGADAGAGFGAGASGTVFGARGSANFLSRSTGVLALLFFCTSLGLAYLGTQREGPKSLLDTAVPVEAPALPAAVPVPGTANDPAQLPALPTAAPAQPSAPGKPVQGQPAGQAPGQTPGQTAGQSGG